MKLLVQLFKYFAFGNSYEIFKYSDYENFQYFDYENFQYSEYANRTPGLWEFSNILSMRIAYMIMRIPMELSHVLIHIFSPSPPC